MKRRHPVETILENVEKLGKHGNLAKMCMEAVVEISKLHEQYYELANRERMISPTMLRDMAKIFEREAEIVENLQKAAEAEGISVGGEIPLSAGRGGFGTKTAPFTFGLRKVKDD